MCDAPKVSVVISTYNRPELLKRCVASVFAQTFTDFEIIVVDDGSFTAKDAMEPFAELAKTRGLRFAVLEMQENSGYQSAPKNIGINYAQGELIAHIDDDDEMLPEHIELLVGALEKNSADLAYGRWINVVNTPHKNAPPDGTEWIWVPFNHLTAHLILMGPMTNFIPSATIYRRVKTLETFGNLVWNEEIRRFGDWELWRRMIQAGFKIVGVDAATFNYHWHGENLQLTRRVDEKMVSEGKRAPEWKAGEICE